MSRVNRLLHDAEHADSGVMMAKIMRDYSAEKRLRDKSRALWDEALRLDPNRTDDAWNETTLKNRP